MYVSLLCSRRGRENRSNKHRLIETCQRWEGGNRLESCSCLHVLRWSSNVLMICEHLKVIIVQSFVGKEIVSNKCYLWSSHDFYGNFVCFGPQKKKESRPAAKSVCLRFNVDGTFLAFRRSRVPFLLGASCDTTLLRDEKAESRKKKNKLKLQSWKELAFLRHVCSSSVINSSRKTAFGGRFLLPLPCSLSVKEAAENYIPSDRCWRGEEITAAQWN